MKTVYQADDGTIFENEDECEVYELKKTLDDLGDDLQFWDEYGKKWDSDYPNCYLEQAYYILIKTTEAWDYLKQLAYLYGLSSPTDDFDGSGLYWYDDTRWRSFGDEMNMLTDILKLLEIDWK